MKIHAIQTGMVRIKTRQRRGAGKGLARQLSMLLDLAWTEWLPIYAWAIEHPEGVIVVDTGETARAAVPGYFPRWHPYFRWGVQFDVLPEQEMGAQLRQLGIGSNDVRTVILTHLHTDHAGGVSAFSQSQIFVSAADYKLAQGFGGELRGYLPRHLPAWFAPQPLTFEPTPFGTFEASCRVTNAGDVIAVPTPGHTPAHVSVIVLYNGVSFFLAGDATYSETLLVAQSVDGVSPDERVARQTIQKILQYARHCPTVYLPSHDPASRDRLEQRTTLKVGAESTIAHAEDQEGRRKP